MYLEEFFEKVNYEKSQQTIKNLEKLPIMKKINGDLSFDKQKIYHRTQYKLSNSDSILRLNSGIIKKTLLVNDQNFQNPEL